MEFKISWIDAKANFFRNNADEHWNSQGYETHETFFGLFSSLFSNCSVNFQKFLFECMTTNLHSWLLQLLCIRFLIRLSQLFCSLLLLTNKLSRCSKLKKNLLRFIRSFKLTLEYFPYRFHRKTIKSQYSVNQLMEWMECSSNHERRVNCLQVWDFNSYTFIR